MKLARRLFVPIPLALAMLAVLTMAPLPASAQGKKPNILVIMGDDVGWFNLGAYHRGIMSGKTPNLDKLAADGMMFTDYYAEASLMSDAGAPRRGASSHLDAGGLLLRERSGDRPSTWSCAVSAPMTFSLPPDRPLARKGKTRPTHWVTS